jgi:sulfate/thiosulfate transport system substrate-binding protein
MKRTSLAALALGVLVSGTAFGKTVTLLNVSYDPTRELYVEFNNAFAKHWKAKTGDDVKVNQSHGGSAKQARGVIDGLPADVVTLALAYDIDAIHEKAGRIPKDWQSKLPHNSAPYTSTVVFVVRKGNPKKIKDWDDVVKEGVSVVPGSPKTSGGARWIFLAAYGYALEKSGGSHDKAKEFVGKLYRNAPVLDSGARGMTTTFAQRGIGDVLINWENEAFLLKKELGDKVEIVTPSISILAEPPVAVVERNANKHGVGDVAKAYLDYLFSDEGQDLAAKHNYRPRSEAVAKKYANKFAPIRLFTIDKVFGGWAKAQPAYFNDGGVFDQIYVAK